jgi:hypothetical protein
VIAVGGRRSIPLEDRFWEKVARCGPDECWPWLSGTYPNGYGKFSITAGNLDQVKTGHHGAHRVAFRLVHGHWPVPGALHGCDNTLCCNAENPAHVHEGTQAQNLQEMTDRGRRAHGMQVASRAFRALTAEQVREIRARYAEGGVTQSDLALAFGISLSFTNYVINHEHHSERCN